MNFISSKKKFFVLFFVLFWQINFSQNQLSSEARVSILSCGRGNEVYSLFGHTAVRIADPKNNLDIVYNYGAFDFNTPNFIAKFTRGDLQYFVILEYYTDFISQYIFEGRAVFEQELNISIHLKQQIFENLNKSLSLEQRYYTYKFIDKNCTTMVVDVINKSLGGEILKKQKTKQTYREILYPYFDGHFYEQLGTSVIFGTKVDATASLLFLPEDLKESLNNTNFQNQPLALQTKKTLNDNSEPFFSWWNNIYTYLLILTIVLVFNNKKVDFVFISILAIVGIFFTIGGLFSLHKELEYNYNILLFNPLNLLLPLLYFKKYIKKIRVLSIFNIFLMSIYVLLIISKVYFLIVLPLIFTAIFVLFRISKTTRNISNH